MTAVDQIQALLQKKVPGILLDGFFLGADPIPQEDSKFDSERGLCAYVESDSPLPGLFFLCASSASIRMLSGALLGSADDDDVSDILAELANVIAGRIALDLPCERGSEPKIGLPKVGQDLFPPPGELDIHLRFRVEEAHLAVGWKAVQP